MDEEVKMFTGPQNILAIYQCTSLRKRLHFD